MATLRKRPVGQQAEEENTKENIPDNGEKKKKKSRGPLPEGLLDESLMPHLRRNPEDKLFSPYPWIAMFGLFLLALTVAFVMDEKNPLEAGPSGRTINEPTRALIIIDVQDCFMDNGTYSGRPGVLAVTNSTEYLRRINQLRLWSRMFRYFHVNLVSQVSHRKNHISFASTHDVAEDSEIELHCKRYEAPNPYRQHSSRPEFLLGSRYTKCCNETSAETLCGCTVDDCISVIQSVKADHCVAAEDAAFPKDLRLYTMGDQDQGGDVIIKRGLNPFLDTYSVFRESQDVWLETAGLLKDADVQELYFAGFGLEEGIYRAVADAYSLGFTNITVLEDASLSFNPEAASKAVEDMVSRGVNVTKYLSIIKNVGQDRVDILLDRVHKEQKEQMSGFNAVQKRFR